ncbi:hypothetical protein OKW26_002710 [Paraburkholderia sp. 32]
MSARLYYQIVNLEQAHIEVRGAAKAYIESIFEDDDAALRSGSRDTTIPCVDASDLIARLNARAAHWQSDQLARHPIACTSATVRFVSAQYAPVGLAPGCVLQNVVHVANCHEPLPAHVHAAHLWHAGDFSLARNHACLYRQLLEHTGQYLPTIDSPMFAEQAELLSTSTDLAACWLALSLSPSAYGPEILGAALFELQVPISPVVDALLRACDATRGHPYLTARHDASRQAAQRHIEHAIGRMLGEPGIDSSAAVARIERGHRMSMHLQGAWHAAIARHVRERLLDPTVAMVELIRRKSRFAVGYHNRLKLADRPFDDYVVQDPEHFVRDLAHSRWIVRGHPEQSLLLTRLVAFGGSMFRVFSGEELDVMRAWIASLPVGASAGPSTNSSRVTTSTPYAQSVPREHRIAESEPVRAASGKVGPRELYHRLLNHENNSTVFDDARAFAETWLARAAGIAERGRDALPFADYTHERLRHWFEDRALHQAQSYAGPGQDIHKPREQVVEEAVQLCPMIFVDGGWVQRWTNAGHVETGIGTLLYKIFSDEIGNGDTQLNHPNIYRDLMRQMGIDLPDFRSRAFAMSELFSEAAFEVPAFWLSISQFPRRFLPETLGLNLAMELSGVGGAYRTARDELRHYQFDTRFVDLHNTIDNVSTGHSAMALQAIELYMDAALATASLAASSTQWRRVWTGFRALAIPRRSWKEVFAKPTYTV